MNAQSANKRSIPLLRLAILIPGAIGLLLGLDAALLLLDLPAPVTWDQLRDVHGLLLVLGAVGTLVSLERAVALKRWWGYLAPAGLGVGGLSLVARAPTVGSGLLFLIGSGVLVFVYVALWRRQPADAVVIQAGGAAMAVCATLLWMGGVAVPVLLPWLGGFLILTVLGERLELARVAIPDRVAAITTLLSGVFAATALVALLWPVPGYRLLGEALLALAVWMGLHDVARRTIRASGLTRFMAFCLLAGYFWLAGTSMIWLVAGPQLDGLGYDAAIHTIFLGFVMSMIMAHAPVILPAVLHVRLPYHPAMYAPAVLLHASLILRVVVGDGFGVVWAWQVGGLLNVVAVLGFMAVAVWSAFTARTNAGSPRQRVPEPAPAPGGDS